MAYAENFHGVSFSGIGWSFVFGMRSFVTSQFDVIFMFPNQRLFYTHSPYFMCHCTEYKLSAYQVRISEENKLNATTQQFITAKMSGCALKQGSKTHLSLRQSYLQRQKQAALMSCRIRAVEHRKYTAGLAGVHPGLQDRNLLSYTRIENAHKAAYTRKRSRFCYV